MYLNGLPASSATWAAVNGLPQGVTMTHILLMDLWAATTGKEHPARPKPKPAAGETAVKFARLKAQRRRLSVAPPPQEPA